MIAVYRISALSAAALAVAGLVAAPVAAAQLPAAAVSQAAGYDSHAGDAQGWGNRGWRRHSGAHIRTGDAIAGIAIIGALAAIAGAANNADRNRNGDDYRDRPVRYRENYRQNERRDDSWNRGGITGAVDLCVNQVERGDERVDSVDQANRDGNGWRVSGTLGSGEGFACRIDNDGRIRSIDMGDGYVAAADQGDWTPVAEGQGQLSDEAYRSARAATRTPIDGAPAAANVASKPGNQPSKHAPPRASNP